LRLLTPIPRILKLLLNPPKKETQPTEPLPPDIPSPKPIDRMSSDPLDQTSTAINTTYLPNRKNDVTCKETRSPADSDESCSAVFISKLEKELQQSFSDKDVAIGLGWYTGLSEDRRKRLKKPIACIIRALKDGYAQKEVEAQNTQVAAQIEKKRRLDHDKKLSQEEKSSNYQLAQHLISKFSTLPGWRHRLYKKCFVIHNDELKPYRDEETGAIQSLMPDGSIHFGTPGIRVDFDLSPTKFSETLKEFFAKCRWASPKPVEVSQ